MDPVQKALWFVESHSREPITLEDIARACKVSPFHLTRAFAASMGLSLMRYVRARRLSEAARQLAEGADDILGIALDVGYGSHEAFTRAFRDHFLLTPEQVRAPGSFQQHSFRGGHHDEFNSHCRPCTASFRDPHANAIRWSCRALRLSVIGRNSRSMAAVHSLPREYPWAGGQCRLRRMLQLRRRRQF